MSESERGAGRTWTERFHSWVDVRTATAGALVMASAVFWVNADHGSAAAAVAAAKQATYTFFFAGLVTRNNERLARSGPARRAVPKAVLVSSAMAVTFTFLLHSLRGTPDPLQSTLVTVAAAPPGFAFLAWRHRSQAAGDAVTAAGDGFA
jgi:uncharacterized membrane protein